MPSTANQKRVPSYRRHKPSGQAVVTLGGRDIYLGKWNTKASQAEYDRLIGEWLVAGRSSPWLPAVGTSISVAELILAYWRHAQGYYVKDGKPTDWQDHVRLMLRILRQSYGHTRAVDFGPLALRAVRQKLIDAGHSRKCVNKLIAIVPRMFKWAVGEELLPVNVYQALRAVEGLRRGRTEARETPPVQPVADDVVNATLPHLPEVVANMVRFQRLTGCRPGEVCIIRPCDVDTSGDVWTYRPESHKTEHHGRDRVICIGPKAQNVLRPYLLRDKQAYCFAPAESEKERNAQRRENRRSPMTPSQAKRRPKRNPRRAPGNRYTTGTYRRAIHRAVELANRKRPVEGQKDLLPKWSPNRLRHSAATEIRRQFGLEAAQVTLGHATADVSQIYAERDLSLAVEIMRKIG